MKTYKLLFGILAILVLPSCRKSNGNVPSFKERTITVTANISQHTKAGYENGVLMPERFIMDVTQGDQAKYNYSLLEMTKAANGNTYSPSAGIDLLWNDDSYDVTVKAITIPMGLTMVDAENTMVINVSLEQNDASNVVASDFLGATSEANRGITIETANINIEFQHLLSKLDVKYDFGSEFDGSSAVINSITLQNVCTTGGYSYADMDYVTTNLAFGDIVMYNDTSASTAEAIFYPYKPTSNPSLFINATIDGVEYYFMCPVVAKDANGFVGGKRYTMNISIVGSSVNGTEASIAKGWDTNTKDESFVTE